MTCFPAEPVPPSLAPALDVGLRHRVEDLP